MFVSKECPMTLIEVVILAGAQCLSPIREAESTTEVGKVPCAVVIRLDQVTGDVAFNPPAAATDPQVIAMLVKPRRAAAMAEAPATEGPGAEGDAPDGIPVVQEPLPEKKKETVTARQKKKTGKTAARLRGAERASSTRKTAARRDVCGSRRAAWYTTKDGRRKYRCVRTG